MFGKTKIITLSVEGMHCAHCQARVEQALKAVKGVRRVTVSLEEKTAAVTATEAVLPDALIAAVKAAGFEAAAV